MKLPVRKIHLTKNVEAVETAEATKADEGKIENIQENVESLKEALNQKNEALLRTVAEYQNYRKELKRKNKI